MAKSPAREAERLQALERRRQCMTLRVQGHSIGEIAERLELSKSTVHGHIKRSLDELAKADIDRTAAYRALQTQRYEGLLKALWPHATGQIEVRKVVAGKDGTTETTITTALDVKAAREARQVITAMARLLGLEAPIKIAHTDPTGEIERSPADWIMPMPPERDPHEWAAETRTMLASREAVADKLVEELLGTASKAGQPQHDE